MAKAHYKLTNIRGKSRRGIREDSPGHGTHAEVANGARKIVIDKNQL